MASIKTVFGPSGPSEIGITSIHEHLIADSTSNRLDPDTKLDDLGTAIEEMLDFKKAGGDAIVDVTTIDMGRNIHTLVEIGNATGVKIIAATGFYKGNYSPTGSEILYRWNYLTDEFHGANTERITDVLARDVYEGIEGTNIKAGIIGEIGTSYNKIMESEEKVFRAAARVNRETGIPISTHTTLGTMGREQIEILKEEGADLSHVVISHMDLISDTDYHIEIARQGVFLGFDTVGKEQYNSDDRRVELIKRMVMNGFEDQIVLSCDIGRRSQMRNNGGRGYAYLLKKFIPKLEAAAIDKDTIDKFLIYNPRRLLAF